LQRQNGGAALAAHLAVISNRSVSSWRSKKMKIQRTLRVGLLLWWLAVVLWITAIPVQAKQTEKALANQNIVAQMNLQEKEDIQIEDITGLDSEFGALEEESVFIVEEVESYREEARRKKIERIVVFALVVVIFGVGIITGLWEKKKNEMRTAKDPDKDGEEIGGRT